jgi:hypothetical protein
VPQAVNNDSEILTPETKPRSKTYPDSSIYWVNEDYLNEIKSGDDVCECMSNNQFLLLHVDFTFEKIIIQSSVYFFGLETMVEMNLKSTDTLNKSFTIDERWPLNSEMKITIDNNMLFVNYGGETSKFLKMKLETLDIPTSPKGIFVQSMDVFDQRNRINAESLLAYTRSQGEENLLSIEELSQLIRSNRVSVGCSDYYHYNSMAIKGDTNRYFHLEFGKDKVTFYEEPEGRGRYEEVNLDKLSWQTFYKKE